MAHARVSTWMIINCCYCCHFVPEHSYRFTWPAMTPHCWSQNNWDDFFDMWALAPLQLKPLGSLESTKTTRSWWTYTLGVWEQQLENVYTISRINKLKPSSYSMSDCASALRRISWLGWSNLDAKSMSFCRKILLFLITCSSSFMHKVVRHHCLQSVTLLSAKSPWFQSWSSEKLKRMKAWQIC